MADFYIVPPRLLVGSFDRAAVVNSINTLKGDLTFTADPLSGVKIVTSGNNLQFGLITDFYVKRSGDTIFGNVLFTPSGSNYGLAVAYRASDPGTGTTGALYFNTTTNELKIYDNTGWNSIQSTSGISEAYANTRYLRLDGTNTPTANLTMGSVLFRLGNLATQVIAGLSGQIYYNTDTNQINLYNGSSWVPIGLGITTIHVGLGLTSNQSPITSVSSLSLNTTSDLTWTGYHTFNQPVTFASAAQSFSINKLFINGQSDGDLITYSSGTWKRLAIGSPNYVLTVDSAGTAVSWKAASSSSGNVKDGETFDLAYYSQAGTSVTGAISIKYNPSTGLYLFNTTNSNNPSNGSIQLAGGIGISGNSSIGGTLLFFNNDNSNFIGFKAGASIASTTYILPISTPNGTGTSVLASTDAGIMYWVGMSAVATGSATTAKNIETILTDNDSSHYLIFSNAYGSSGVALSSSSGLLLNPSSDSIIAGNWRASAIATTYGGTGFTAYNKGDLLVGSGSSLLEILPKGTDKYFLTSNSIFPNGIGWTTVTGVAITELPPTSPNYADLWWNDNDGSLSIYYDDGNTSQWVEIISGYVGVGDYGIVYNSPQYGIGYYPNTGNGITASLDFTNNTDNNVIELKYTTESTNTTSGALQISGGIAVSGNVSIGNTVLIWNSQNSNYIGIRAGSSIASTIYTLPVSTPTAVGTSVLSSTQSGILSWVPMTATGSGEGTVYTGAAQRLAYYSVAGSAITDTYGINYNNSGTASTFTIFGGSSIGSTIFIVQAISSTSVKVGIGLTNPAYELEVNGEISATSKSFVINHPTKNGMKLRYGSLEGPENGVYIRGILKDNNVIETPDYWKGLVDQDSFTVNLTPIGTAQSLFIDRIENYKVYVGTGGTIIHCYFYVLAERKDVDKLIVEY